MKNIIFISGIIFFIVFSAAFVFAETEDDSMQTLDEVVVTAARTAKDIKTVPANVTVITAEEITDSGASSIVEVLESQANVHMRTYSGNPAQAQIDLRGFGENGFGRTLVLLDGRRLNRPDLSSINWTQLPLDQIERIEVVRGSASVLYGDSAIAGVIHIITKKGAVDPSISVSLQGGEDGFHDEKAGVVGSSDRLSYSVNAANQQTDGWRDRTAFHAYGGGFQLGFDLTDKASISGGGSYNRSDFEMPGPLTKAQLAIDRTQVGADYRKDEAQNEFYNGNLLLEGSLGSLGDAEINLVYGNTDIKTSFDHAFWNLFSNIEIQSFGIQPKYILVSEHGTLSNQLVTGVDVYHETINVDKFSDAAKQIKTHESKLGKDTLGWYVRNEISFADIFFLSGGVRIEKAEIFGESITVAPLTVVYDTDKDHKGEVFELSATWLPIDHLKLYSRYSTVYRYPFTDEQATYYGSPWSPDSFNPTIEAEKGQSIETGIELNPGKDLSLGLTLFQIDMEDEISLNAFYVSENLDDTRHRGLELFLDYQLQDYFALNVNYTFQESSFEAGSNTGNDIPLVPKNLLSANLDISLPYDLHFITDVRYVDETYLSGDFSNSEEKLDDYTVVDFLLRYKRKVAQIKLTAFIGVSNVFDEEYCTWGDVWGNFYPSPGRKFYGGISGTF